MVFGRYGILLVEDYIIYVDVILKGGLFFERIFLFVVFRVCDDFI